MDRAFGQVKVYHMDGAYLMGYHPPGEPRKETSHDL